MALFAPVHLHNRLRIDGKLLVRVDDHTEKAGVGLQWARRRGPQLAACLWPRGRHGAAVYSWAGCALHKDIRQRGCHSHHDNVDLNICYSFRQMVEKKLSKLHKGAVQMRIHTQRENVGSGALSLLGLAHA